MVLHPAKRASIINLWGNIHILQSGDQLSDLYRPLMLKDIHGRADCGKYATTLQQVKFVKTILNSHHRCNGTASHCNGITSTSATAKIYESLRLQLTNANANTKISSQEHRYSDGAAFTTMEGSGSRRTNSVPMLHSPSHNL